MRASKADSHRNNFVLSSSSPLKTSGFAWVKRWSWVTLAKASVICCGLRLKRNVKWRVSIKALASEILINLLIHDRAGYQTLLE